MDGFDGDFEDQLSRIQQLLEEQDNIQRKALRAVAQAIKPKLAEVTPERVSTKQGGDSLEPGELKASVSGHVHISTGGDDASYALVDFGKKTHIARFVDEGHAAPYSKGLKKEGKPDTRSNIPAYPFVRQVQDSIAEEAQTTYEAVIQAETERILNGR